MPLLAFANAVEKNSARLIEAQSRSTGQISHFIAKEEVAARVDHLRFFSGAARLPEGKASGEYLPGLTSSIRRELLGVVGQVVPWNWPLLMSLCFYAVRSNKAISAGCMPGLAVERISVL